MRRSISTFALLFTSVSAILGSGWLFVSYYTSTLAGPAALLSWLFGGLAMIFIAFIFAELCTMLPITGSSTRIPQYTHGTIVSFLFSWVIWLSYASLVPTEVQAVIQYLSFFYPALTLADSSLSHLGYLVASLLMLIISAINIFSLRWLLRCNNVLTVMKIIIPTSIAIIILHQRFDWSHIFHPAHSPFAPHGLRGVFEAIATGGIVFAFNGFKQACEMAGEAKNPKRTLPIAILGSIIVCLTVYILLQMAFYSSLTGANYHGSWADLTLPGSQSPMAAILSQDHLTELMPFLYIGAITGPLAAGLIYASSASRSIYGMSKNHHIPQLFQQLSQQGNPIYGILLNFFLGMFMFAPLPGWDQMVKFLTSLMSITYAIGPVCLLSLRYQTPELERPFRLPAAKIWSAFAFYICTLLIYWSGWQIISKLGIALIIGLCVLFIHRHLIKNEHEAPLNLKASIWVWPYFSGIMLISYLGNFGHGHGILPFGTDFIIIGIFCVLTLYLAIRYRLPNTETMSYIKKLELPE